MIGIVSLLLVRDRLERKLRIDVVDVVS